MRTFELPCRLRSTPFCRARSVWLAAVILLPAATSRLAAEILPLGDEVAISQPNGDFESSANVAADRRGGWGVTWQVASIDFSHRNGRQRRLDRDGGFLPGSLLDHVLEHADLGLDGEGRGAVVGIRERPDLGGAEVDALCVDIQGLPRAALNRVDAGVISPISRRPDGVRMAMDSDGSSVVTWQENPRVAGVPPSVFFRRLLSDCTASGEVGSLGAVGVVGRRQPHVAYRADGGFVLVWIEGEQADQLHVMAQLFDRQGMAVAPAFVVAQSARRPSHPSVAVSPAGTFAVLWKSDLAPPSSGTGTGIAARVFAADSTPLGGELALRTPRPPNTAESAVAAVGGSFVAVWGENGFVEEGSAVYARVFEALAPVGGEVQVNAAHTDPGNVRIATLGGNEFVVVWDDFAEGTLPQDIVGRRFVLAPSGLGCAASSSTLCLGAERFRIAVEWRDYQGRRGTGQAHPLTGDSGLFWFFNDANLEVLVKVVDACTDYSRHWLYAAATTDVEYTLTATDSTSGRSRSYFNPLGRSSPAVTDTDAFATCP